MIGPLHSLLNRRSFGALFLGALLPNPIFASTRVQQILVEIECEGLPHPIRAEPLARLSITWTDGHFRMKVELSSDKQAEQYSVKVTAGIAAAMVAQASALIGTQREPTRTHYGWPVRLHVAVFANKRVDDLNSDIVAQAERTPVYQLTQVIVSSLPPRVKNKFLSRVGPILRLNYEPVADQYLRTLKAIGF